MREKNWLVRVLEEASKRVETWPDWKKSTDLQVSQHKEEGEEEQKEQDRRCA